MRIAIIDLGTNTFNLLVVEENDGAMSTLHNSKIPVKLGEGAIAKGFIADDAFQRGIEAIGQYLQTIETFKVEEVKAFATSGVRSTSNGGDFIKEIDDRYGLAIEVISGDQEAEYIYYGVRQVIPMTDAPDLIMDIGGGSTEFIIANKKEIFWKQSFLLGVSRLKEIFQPSDPITEEEQEKIREHLNQELQPLLQALEKYEVNRLLGSSGSFETFADLITHQFYQPSLLDGVQHYEIQLADYQKIHQQLVLANREERLEMKGMLAMRVDFIVLASLLTTWVVENCRTPNMIMSTYAMKEGVLWKILNP